MLARRFFGFITSQSNFLKVGVQTPSPLLGKLSKNAHSGGICRPNRFLLQYISIYCSIRISVNPEKTERIPLDRLKRTGLVPTPEPPRIIVVPTGGLNAPMDLVEEAMAVFSFPEVKM